MLYCAGFVCTFWIWSNVSLQLVDCEPCDPATPIQVSWVLIPWVDPHREQKGPTKPQQSLTHLLIRPAGSAKDAETKALYGHPALVLAWRLTRCLLKSQTTYRATMIALFWDMVQTDCNDREQRLSSYMHTERGTWVAVSLLLCCT